MTRDGILLGQLEAFIEVARLGSVTRAADTLFVTQPAVSARLTRLEHAVGTTLVARSGRGVRLTETGVIFLPFARRAVAAMEEAQRAIHLFSGGPGSQLTIGATPTLASYVLPAVVNRILQADPGLNVAVRSAASEDLVQLLLGGEIHLAVCRAVHHRDLESMPLYEEELTIVASPTHRLAHRPSIAIAELANEVLIALHRSRSYSDVVDSVLRQASGAPRAVVDIDNSDVAKHMVKEGVGVALLPRTAVAEDLQEGGLVELKVADIPTMRRAMVLLWRRGGSEPRARSAFVRFLRSELAQKGSRLSDGARESADNGDEAVGGGEEAARLSSDGEGLSTQ